LVKENEKKKEKSKQMKTIKQAHFFLVYAVRSWLMERERANPHQRSFKGGDEQASQVS
jgi:hypothetical protein